MQTYDKADTLVDSLSRVCEPDIRPDKTRVRQRSPHPRQDVRHGRGAVGDRTCLARGHRDPAQQTLDTTKNLAVVNLLQKRSTEANKSLKS